MKLFVETPLWESPAISERIGRRAVLKMEAFQPAGSFKSRGMGAACLKAKENGVEKVVCSSGGNAGLAVAYAGRVLGLDVTIVVPERTGDRARALIAREGARLVVHGDAWDDAHDHAVRLAEETGSAYIHPFDDPEVWRGHSAIIREVRDAGLEPGLIVVSVGGGGLLSGLLLGMDEAGWGDVPVLTVETEGADSFAQAMAAGELVTLPGITSIATTLGAQTVCRQALDSARRHRVTPLVVSDRQALDACIAFAEDHRVLVEPACGAALAAGYEALGPVTAHEPVLFIVCGGAAVTPGMLGEWGKELKK
ncbi:MAG TPA: pyridoxal-phosphate dependent enzyme [Anaerolineales bacterium]|nr:pyridoxal-phosphate dependent enzyme [Anaerolineales bacterium]